MKVVPLGFERLPGGRTRQSPAGERARRQQRTKPHRHPGIEVPSPKPTVQLSLQGKPGKQSRNELGPTAIARAAIRSWWRPGAPSARTSGSTPLAAYELRWRKCADGVEVRMFLLTRDGTGVRARPSGRPERPTGTGLVIEMSTGASWAELDTGRASEFGGQTVPRVTRALFCPPRTSPGFPRPLTGADPSSSSSRPKHPVPRYGALGGDQGLALAAPVWHRVTCGRRIWSARGLGDVVLCGGAGWLAAPARRPPMLRQCCSARPPPISRRARQPPPFSADRVGPIHRDRCAKHPELWTGPGRRQGPGPAGYCWTVDHTITRALCAATWEWLGGGRTTPAETPGPCADG